MRRAIATRPDVIITDLVMPKMGGIEMIHLQLQWLYAEAEPTSASTSPDQPLVPPSADILGKY